MSRVGLFFFVLYDREANEVSKVASATSTEKGVLSMYKKQEKMLRRYVGSKVLEIFDATGVDYCIAGGACCSVFAGLPINDVDVFFATREDFNKGQRIVESGLGWESKYTSERAISYQNEITKHKLQLIDLVYGKPEQIISNFDFTITMCAWHPKDGFIFDKNFFYHLAERLLVWNPRGEYIIASLCRAIKYKDRGFKLTSLELVKMSLGINNLHLKTYRDLKKQLEGIDTVLLKQLTDTFLDKKDVEFEYNEFLDILNSYLEEVFIQI